MRPSTQKKLLILLSVLLVVLGVTQFLTYKKLKEYRLPKLHEEHAMEVTKRVESAGKLVLIIDDFGYRDDEVSNGFLNLDIPFTCAIIPGHTQSRRFARLAVEAGKEVIVHMPMESTLPTSGEEEYILSTKMISQEIEARVRKALKHLPEAAGMNNHQGSKATADRRVMGVLGNVLKETGKYFIDSRTTGATVAENIMRSLGVKTRRRNVFLDNDADPELIRQQLEELVRTARKYGVAVGIGHAKPNTLAVLEAEIPRLLTLGFEFEFASSVMAQD